MTGGRIRNSRLFLLATGLLAAAAFLALFEATSRLLRLDRCFDADFRFYVRHIDNDLGEDVPYNREDPFLMWSLTPGYSGYGVSVNADGFRDRDIPREKGGSEFRILCLGDSTTFGLRVTQNNDFPARLEELLRAKYAGTPVRCEVINGGVTGYSTLQSLLLYRYRGVRYDPDIVILTGGINDRNGGMFHLSDREVLRPHVPDIVKRVESVLLHLHVYRLLRKGASVLLSAPGDRQEERRGVRRVGEEELRDNILTLQSLVRNNGSVLVLLLPTISPATDDKVLRDRCSYVGPMAETAREAGVPCVRVGAMSPDAPPENAAYFLEDDCVHPNEEGHLLVAETLLRFLDSNGLLPDPDRRGG